VKEFLSQNGVHFIEKDIQEDEAAMRKLQELDVMATPTTVIDGEVVIGWDEARLKELLKL
jgi:glutaredoxin